MKARLREIVSKLAESKQAALLSEDDYAYLAGLVSNERTSAADSARPLWEHIRPRAIFYGPIFELPRWDFSVNKILVEAGMDTGNLTYDDNERRWIEPVTSAALRRALTWALQQDDGELRYHAAVLIGYAGYEDMLAPLLDDIESGRGERAAQGGSRIAGALQALAMFEHPRAAPLALAYMHSDDWSIRNTARLVCLLCQDQLDTAQLASVFDGAIEVYDFTRIPHAFTRAAVRGALSREHLEQLLDGIYLTAHATEYLADLIVSADWRDSFEQYIAHTDPDMRTALALRVAWSDASWATEALRTQLEQEDQEEARMALLAALGSFGEDDDDLLQSKFEDGSPWEITGAVWGSLGRSKFEPQLRAQLRHPDPLVSAAAACALAALTPEHPEAIELAWNTLLNRDDWWPWAVGLRALRGRGTKLPQSLQGFVYVTEVKKTFAEIDEATSFFAAHPMELLRWLGKDASVRQVTLTLPYAGLVGGETMRSAAEQALIAMPTVDESAKAARELVALGGPEHALGRVKTGLAMSPRYALDQDDLLPCVVLASQGPYDIHVRAAAALGRFGIEAEATIAELLFHPENSINEAAAEAITRLHAPEHPVLRDVAALLEGSVRSVSELETVERLFNCPAKRVREALAEASTRSESEPAQILHMLLRLAVDKEPTVTTAAAAALSSKMPDAAWVKELVLRNSQSSDWQLSRGSIATMAQVGDPMFVPRLVELATAEDTYNVEVAVRGLERVAERFPALGLIVLDIHDPYRLATQYGLADQVNHQADRLSEGLRILMLALDRKRVADRAVAEQGRKVMLTPLHAGGQLVPTDNGWDEVTFEQLALYLEVTFVDEDTGTIIAEVATEPTGEVLSALLQTRSVCATTIAWS